MRYLFTLLIMSAAACSPHITQPSVELPARYLAANDSQHNLDLEWWHIFNDNKLNRVITTALEQNRELAATLTTIERERAAMNVARSKYLPSLSMDIEMDNEKYPKQGTDQDYTIAPTINWDLSLFGAMRHTNAAARAELLSTEWNARAVKLALIAEVATTYFTLRQAERSEEIARSNYTLREDALMLIDSLFKYGMRDGVALEQARALTLSAKGDVANFHRLAQQSALSLSLLMGDNPAPYIKRGGKSPLSSSLLPAEVPAGLPSELLERRPDIMVSRYTMEGAEANVRLARAARFPSISLTGSAGIFASSIKGITASEPWGWSATGAFVQPIFAFGALKDGERKAQSEYLAQVYKYEQSILAALSEVEQALVSIDSYREQITAAAAVVQANSKVEYMTRELYLGGMNSYLEVVDAERELYTSQRAYIDKIVEQYINYINLFKALGGGW